MNSSTLKDIAKDFLNRHLWARVVATVLMVALMPVWLVAFICALVFYGPYESVCKWARKQ